MNSMITRINPDNLHPTPGYHHITIVETARTAYLAGQCPLDEHGTLVGLNDLDAQVDRVVANALIALRAVGAEPGNVVRSVVYVVTDQQAVLDSAWQRFTRSRLRGAFDSAVTLLGVAQLGYPGQVVEVDFTVGLGGYQ
jgi:enamine deaminase RidA (YjgF/YER057c/UK114 family)